MQAHWFQHVPFEGLGCIEGWLLGAGYEVTSTRFHENPVLPDIGQVDALIVMGGPMSVNDVVVYPWLLEERAFIRRAIQLGVPVLGICLGAQLLAAVLGGQVFPDPEREIGWFPVRAVEGDGVFRFPAWMEAFHWHGETFSLPPGAVRLAESDACRNQAFQWGRSVMGLQFHLESTPESVEDLVRHCGADLAPSVYVHTEHAILSKGGESYDGMNRMMGEVLSYLVGAKD